MDKKAIIKNVLFIILVPSIIVASYYGYKFAKKKYQDYKLKNDGKQ